MAVCRDLPPESLERVLNFAREAATPIPPSLPLDPEAERQRRKEALESWLSLSTLISASLPPGTSLVEAIYEEREERTRTLQGRK